MISKTFYFTIILRVMAIMITALVSAFLAFYFHQWIYAGIGILLLIWQGFRIVYTMNRTNRQLAFFFDAIRNEDSTLSFPVKTGNKAVTELNASMNRLNLLISDAKLRYRMQEQYYETILEHAATGLMSFDERGNILMVNSAVKRLLGCEPLTHLQQLDRIDPGLSGEFKSLVPNGQKLVKITNERCSLQLSLRATHMTARNKNLTLVSVQDIRNELDEKETESWIRLIRVLTHEIMNSIAPITSLSDTMAGYFEKNGTACNPEDLDEQTIANTIKGLAVIRERGSGLVNFVDSYRKLTHLHTPQRKDVELQLFLEKVKILLCAELNFSQISLNIELEQPGMRVSIDENLFSQVLINLVRNAWEALESESNGSIMIKAREKETGRTLIEVIDNGPGIPAELLDKIFVPFFTTREHGSGIGLSLSRQIMRLHGGTLSVQSRPGNTCFELVV